MNTHFPIEAQQIMNERFGHDRLMTIATSIDNIPYLRAVNCVYQDGCFYFLTLSQSSKVKQMSQNPVVAICGEWFNGHGTALYLGRITDQKNHEIVKKVQNSFENWMNDGKIDSFNQEVVLMCVKLSKATLYNDGKRFDLLF